MRERCMKEKKVQVIGVGSPVIDFVSEIEEQTIDLIGGEKGGMELVDQDLLQSFLTLAGGEPAKTPGGSAANTIFALTRMGMDCAFIGKLGNDPNGRYFKELFNDIGGDCSRFKTDGDQATACCVSLVTPDAERTMRTCLGAAQNLTPGDIALSDFEGCGHVHMEGYLAFNRHLIESILQTAKSAGCTVSLDLGSFEVVEASRNFLPRMLLDYVDMVFANEDETAAFTGLHDTRGGLDVLGRLCKVVAVKMGKNGAWLKNGGLTVHVPAMTTDRLCDTTGAGDYWAAGFLYGHLNEYSLLKSGVIASLMGRHVIEQKGAALQQETWDYIMLNTANILNKKEKETYKDL